MASLKTLFQGTSSGTVSIQEALPTFGVWNNYANNTYPVSTVDSKGQVMASGYYYTSSEGWNSFSGQSRTDGAVSSGSDGSTFWFQGTPNNQSEGHYRYAFPTNSIGYANMLRPYGNHQNSYWPYFGTVIGPSGFRQKISIYTSNTTMEVHKRGSYRIDYFGLSNGTHYNTSGTPGTTCYGQTSYNSRINRFVLLQGDGSNNYRLHVWTNPNINLNREDYAAGDLDIFLRQAYAGTNGASYYYNDFNWQTSGSTSYNESRYHNRIVLGDNGRIGIARMTPSNQTASCWIAPNPASTSLSTSPQNINTLGLTTSYGIEQGNAYGMRTTMNWDNSAVACYSPYYYYGSGINMHYISTVDPSQQAYYQDGSTSWGVSVYPVGKTSFGVRSTGNNTDGGNGVYTLIHNPSSGFNTGRDNYGSAFSTGAQVYNWGMYWAVDTGYTSTNYPHIAAMNSWTYTGTGA